MSHQLERLLARLTAQKLWLRYAAQQIADLTGAVLELGLGKGRTYDHLRQLLPDRQILAFDLNLHAPAAACPPTDQLWLGDFRLTLPQAQAALGESRAALAHADFGTEDPHHDATQAAWLGQLILPMVQPGGLVLSDRPICDGRLLALRPFATAWPYYAYRVEEI